MTSEVTKLQEKFTHFIYNSTDIEFTFGEQECQDYRFDMDEYSVWVRANSDGTAYLEGGLPASVKTKFLKWVKANKIHSVVEFQ